MIHMPIEAYLSEMAKERARWDELREALEKIREIVCNPTSCCFPTLTVENQVEV